MKAWLGNSHYCRFIVCVNQFTFGPVGTWKRKNSRIVTPAQHGATLHVTKTAYHRKSFVQWHWPRICNIPTSVLPDSPARIPIVLRPVMGLAPRYRSPRMNLKSYYRPRVHNLWTWSSDSEIRIHCPNPCDLNSPPRQPGAHSDWHLSSRLCYTTHANT